MIKFGTDGWRAIISDEFTFRNVRAVAQAIAEYFLDHSQVERGLIIGYDSRFLSDKYAKECARVIAANGLKVFLTSKVTPTPVVSYLVRSLRAAGAIVITASHNPAEYNGIKIKGDFGGSALPSMICEIEKKINQGPVREMRFEDALNQGLVSKIDPDPYYYKHLLNFINLKAFSYFPFKVIIDPMYGAASGYIKKFLEDIGVESIEIRGEFNPGFKNINPEPIEKNLKELQRLVIEETAAIGIATDGDGDRVGAIDRDGTFINPHYIFALLLRHLVLIKRWRGAVVKTFSTTKIIDKLAQKYELDLFETPIGFKYICEIFLTKNVLIGGEESGGIGFKNHVPERDGILSSLLLLEIMATHKKNLGELIKELMEEVGSHYYSRLDLELSDPSKKDLINYLKGNSFKSFNGLDILFKQNLDGVKFYLEDGSWVLFRASGTEPMIRIYAESYKSKYANELLNEGKKLFI
ncbi:phosphoglucomutase/phosphomannomutase family protein [Desulforamulus ruminis]|uniref:phosphoglucomutase/phosphomannomutase family protein n=1 Tax=Desulforamulus ruminis TaxID=1564 RepID=UPI0023520B55|nr:phosphoglucomutase/phosphomannomutase family protein [Desulforamulus ruminis]